MPRADIDQLSRYYTIAKAICKVFLRILLGRFARHGEK
jgi:hypothetical protein